MVDPAPRSSRVLSGPGQGSRWTSRKALVALGATVLFGAACGASVLWRMNREAAIARMAEATADLGDSYLEITRKKRSSETKRYEVTYRFQVGDRGYEGKESLQAAPTQSLYRVHYLPEDPSFNALNPSKLLDWPTLSAILSGVLCGVGAVILALELLAGAGPKRAAPGR